MISFYLEMFFVHIDPFPCALFIMRCAIFMKFQDKQGRNYNGNTGSIFFN